MIGGFGSGAVAELPVAGSGALTAHDVTGLALVSGSASLERIAAGTDAGGLVPDLHDTNSWVQTMRRSPRWTY
ncbi:SDR family NAD(P)-dependent oxidoreductase [Streptomyces hirsutus]